MAPSYAKEMSLFFLSSTQASDSWDLGKGSSVCIHFQLNNGQRVEEEESRGHKDIPIMEVGKMHLGATSLRVMNCLSEFHLPTTARCGSSVLPGV